MKKVLLLCEAYGGGVKTYVDAISTSASFDQVELTTCISSMRVNEEPDETYVVKDCFSFGVSPWKCMQSLKALHQIVQCEKIDVLHANSTFSGVLLLLYKQLYRKKLRYVYTPHGYYSFKKMPGWKQVLVRFVERAINASCDQVIHVSKSEEIEAIRHQLVPPNKSIVIFNGVEEPARVIKQMNQQFTIVNVARVDEQKNPRGFIELAHYLLAHYPQLRFIWAGDGQLIQEMRQEVKRLGREGHIQFIGYVDDPRSLLATADLYCSTSFYEGLPFSVVEAMSYKVPLLLSNNVGHRDLIVDGRNGLLFTLGEEEKVRQFIATCLQNEGERQAMAHHSYLLFKEQFHVQPMLAQLEAVYIT